MLSKQYESIVKNAPEYGAIETLANNVFSDLKKLFPDIELVEIIKSPHAEDEICIRLVPPVDTEKESQFSRLAAEMTTDILVDSDISIFITYARNP